MIKKIILMALLVVFGAALLNGCAMRTTYVPFPVVVGEERDDDHHERSVKKERHRED